MQTQTIDQLVKDILTDMSQRKKNTTPHKGFSSAPSFEDAFGELIPENDETNRDVMHRIWKELQGTNR